jgi:hypothetical protein
MSNPIRKSSTDVRQTIKRLFFTAKRNRLVALFILAALTGALAFSTTSYATRLVSKVAPSLGAQSGSPKADGDALSGTNLINLSEANPNTGLEARVQKVNGQVVVNRIPKESRLVRARQFTGDLRDLPNTKPVKKERPEREPPETIPGIYGSPTGDATQASSSIESSLPGGPNAPAPSTVANFEGLDFATWGAGHPPDTNGDVGKDYYIQSVNTSLGIYRKSDGVRVAAFTFDTFMSQGNFGNLCDTDNFGDPVVLYDTFEDRWIITDFAFQVDGSGNIINPPGVFQCFAASKTGDPVTGGWNFFSLPIVGGIDDYPKFGIWPDGLYMSANMFGYPAGASFQGPRVWALNKAQMYANSPTVQVVSFDAPASEFTLLPSNARLQAGTPPAGSPNYFSVVWQFTNAISVYKFHVDWNSISTSTFTGPFITIAPASWASPPSSVPSQGGNNLDTLGIRLMMQNQYTNQGGVESLWNIHTVQGSSTTQSAVRYYQVGVTGGTIAANTTQAATHNPDATNRFMPSVAVDRAGNMALGYSTSSSASLPAIKYAGRLSTDALNTIPQTETSLINGTGTQTGNCGGAACTRWGDYSTMSLDPDGCTFWYTNEYYQVTGLNDNTRIGSFAFSQCIAVTSGTVQGTVTATVGGAPINGATVALGSRTTTTDVNGFYSFTNIPSGTYPSITASKPGFSSSTATNIVVTDGATTTQNFSLSTAVTSACLTDTSQADFQMGVPTLVDLTSSPGNVILLDAVNIDQQNISVTSSGFGFNSTSWFGQTFTAGVTGTLVKADIDLFCSGCTGTTPNITVALRATSGNLPTGSDLATATIPGFSSGAGGFFTATFSTPPTLTAGTQYALVLRPVSNPSAGTYAYVVSTGSPYAGGRRVTSANSGSSWTGATTDIGFKTYMKTGFALSGNQVSGLKDANPATGSTPNWTTLSWTASTPAGTTVKFQVAASNSASGPFNFVGPDGTAATFFTTTGASLAQFNGLRYLKYKAYLSSTSSAVTPTLNDVAVCFSNTMPASPIKPPYDYDGDGKSDLSNFTGTTGLWDAVASGNPGGPHIQRFWGSTSLGDIMVPADYDNDGKCDFAVYRNGIWYISRNVGGDLNFTWGTSTDIPVPADYDNDGMIDIAIYRPTEGAAQGLWYVLKSSSNYTTFDVAQFGASTDLPVIGDYNGDGRSDYAVIRRSGGVMTWYILYSGGNTFAAAQWGLDTGDVAVPGDYDADHKTDIAVWRPSNGTWYISKSTGGFTAAQWGALGDIPVAADYDGDMKTDIGVYRPSDNTWYTVGSTSGISINPFGGAGTTPIPSAYNR